MRHPEQVKVGDEVELYTPSTAFAGVVEMLDDGGAYRLGGYSADGDTPMKLWVDHDSIIAIGKTGPSQ